MKNNLETLTDIACLYLNSIHNKLIKPNKVQIEMDNNLTNLESLTTNEKTDRASLITAKASSISNHAVAIITLKLLEKGISKTNSIVLKNIQNLLKEDSVKNKNYLSCLIFDYIKIHNEIKDCLKNKTAFDYGTTQLSNEITNLSSNESQSNIALYVRNNLSTVANQLTKIAEIIEKCREDKINTQCIKFENVDINIYLLMLNAQLEQIEKNVKKLIFDYINGNEPPKNIPNTIASRNNIVIELTHYLITTDTNKFTAH